MEGKAQLDAAREVLRYLCEPVAQPREMEQYLHYFCGHAKKRCEWRAIASHWPPGMVAHHGNARAIGEPLSGEVERPSTPVVSNSWPAMRV